MDMLRSLDILSLDTLSRPILSKELERSFALSAEPSSLKMQDSV
jgi:hypothetical protein